jgi:hypothetical protein
MASRNSRRLDVKTFLGEAKSMLWDERAIEHTGWSSGIQFSFSLTASLSSFSLFTPSPPLGPAPPLHPTSSGTTRSTILKLLIGASFSLFNRSITTCRISTRCHSGLSLNDNVRTPRETCCPAPIAPRKSKRVCSSASTLSTYNWDVDSAALSTT